MALIMTLCKFSTFFILCVLNTDFFIEKIVKYKPQVKLTYNEWKQAFDEVTKKKNEKL